MVSKATVEGKPVYTAWSTKDRDAIGYFDESTKARKCCEYHYKKVKNG